VIAGILVLLFGHWIWGLLLILVGLVAFGGFVEGQVVSELAPLRLTVGTPVGEASGGWYRPDGGMDAYLAIVSKRDERSFDPRPVPEDALQRIHRGGTPRRQRPQPPSRGASWSSTTAT